MLWHLLPLSYTEIRHRTANGVNSYYEILKMPPLFRFAESIGKISSIPLDLVDIPVNKTDSALSVQSFLFRSIEEMKQNGEKELLVEWDTISTLPHRLLMADSNWVIERKRQQHCFPWSPMKEANLKNLWLKCTFDLIMIITLQPMPCQESAVNQRACSLFTIL